jgi:hypothetical protein
MYSGERRKWWGRPNRSRRCVVINNIILNFTKVAIFRRDIGCA